ncbi:MAG: hypothetical protein ACFFBD_19670 [Candidatus Hodarchaeota archaeon]
MAKKEVFGYSHFGCKSGFPHSWHQTWKEDIEPPSSIDVEIAQITTE